MCIRYGVGGGTPPPYEHVVTWYHSSGGLPHQCAHWFAMTWKTALVRNDVLVVVRNNVFLYTPPGLASLGHPPHK